MDSFKEFVTEGFKDWWQGTLPGYHDSKSRSIYDGLSASQKADVATMVTPPGGSGLKPVPFDQAVQQVIQMGKSLSSYGKVGQTNFSDPTKQANPRGFATSSDEIMKGKLQAKDLTPYHKNYLKK